MAGTDHGKSEGWTGPQPVTILVRPQMGENIGAAARGMWNFGLDTMRLVAPRDGWPNERAVTMASGAARVIDGVSVHNDLSAAIGDLEHVYATTARDRDLTKPVMTPEQAMMDARNRIAAGQRVGVLYGPERAGLENEDVAVANTIISVPVNPEFASLNLAQCVLLVSYEWKKSSGARIKGEVFDQASHEEITHLMARLENRLDAVDFFWPDDKAASMRINLRNLLSRLDLTPADVRMLHGVIKTLGRERSREET